MKHIDEHTLAAYALGVAFPAKKKAAIATHLRKCHGCRAQVQDLRQINRSVLEARKSGTLDDVPLPEALVRVSTAVQTRDDTPMVPVPVAPQTRLARFGRLVRHHPLGTGSFVIVMALGAFMLVSRVSPPSPEQPAVVRLNAIGTAYEVYGERNTKLWEIPVAVTPRTADLDALKGRFLEFGTCLADLDGDGNLEVLTGAPFPKDETVVYNVLRVFDRTGSLRFAVPLGAPIAFRGTRYSGQFLVNSVIVTGSPGAKAREILVGVNNDRSPSYLARIDHQGKVLGEYWHFGWMSFPSKVHLRAEQRELVLLHGINDVQYLADSNFAAFTVVDPSRIQGQTESMLTPGFGLPPSTAEVYYARVGNVAPGAIPGSRAILSGFDSWSRTAEDSAFSLRRMFARPEGLPEVSYTFDNTLRVRSVWLADGAKASSLRKLLVRKSPAGYDGFVHDLMSKVQYWDGAAWRPEPTRILSAPSPLP